MYELETSPGRARGRHDEHGTALRSATGSPNSTASGKLPTADDGRIWTWPGGPGVKRYSSHLDDDIWSYYSPLEGFDVFDVDGRWLGRVHTPATYGAMPFPGVGDPLIRGDTVWAVTVDEWGANYVTKFVVEWQQ